MEKIKSMSKKSKIIMAISLGIVLILAVVIGIVIYTMSSKSGETHMSSDSLYMEETVEVQDIIVGLSESATATLLYTEISAEYGMEVEEVYVVSGQTVVEGEIIAKVNLDNYDESYDSVSAELEAAELALTQLELETEVKLVQAANSLATTNAEGENAKTVYNLAIAEVDDGLTEIDAELDEIEEEIDDIEYQIANGLTDDCGVADAAAAVTAMETKIASLEAEIAASADTSGTDAVTDTAVADDTTDLQETLTGYYSQLTELETAYEKACDDYDTEYNSLSTQLSSLESQYSSQTTSRAKYVSTMDTQKAQALATYNLSIANYSTAQDTYDITVYELETAIEEAEEQVADLEEELADEDSDEDEEDEETLIYDEEGYIYAPTSGYIMSVEEVDIDMEGVSPLNFTIADSDCVELSLSISQDDIANIEVGMDVSIVFDSYEDTPIETTVESLEISSSSLMTSSVNYTVTIMCDIPTITNEGETLVVYQGMTATATLVLRQAEDVLAVSTKCITSEDGKEYVTILVGEDTLQQVEVVTGFSDGFDVEITSGVEEGDIVIIESAVTSSAY